MEEGTVDVLDAALSTVMLNVERGACGDDEGESMITAWVVTGSGTTASVVAGGPGLGSEEPWSG